MSIEDDVGRPMAIVSWTSWVHSGEFATDGYTQAACKASRGIEPISTLPEAFLVVRLTSVVKISLQNVWS